MELVQPKTIGQVLGDYLAELAGSRRNFDQETCVGELLEALADNGYEITKRATNHEKRNGRPGGWTWERMI